MDQSPAPSPDGAAPALDETQALAALKDRINDSACPTLELARSLETHLNAYPQSRRVLADKLGMPEKRTYLTEVIGLLKLPAQELEKIQGTVLARRAIQKLQAVEQPETAADHVDQGVDQRRPPVDHGVDHVDQTVDHVDQTVDHVDQIVDHVDQTVDQPKNRVDRVKSADIRTIPCHPLLRDTVNAIARVMYGLVYMVYYLV